jgi:hypothetical protein
VPEAFPGHRSRQLVRLVLAILGLIALAGPADASTCHAPERPTFGIDDVSVPALELTTSTPTHYDRAPCPGESAGFPSKLHIPRVSPSDPLRLDPITRTEPRWIEFADLRRPLAESNPLERPPRDRSTLPSS